MSNDKRQLLALARALELQELHTIKLSSGGGSLTHRFEVPPYEFLQAAEDNIEIRTPTALADALTNARRAINCQMDEALASLGYNSMRWDTRKKIDTLGNLGFVAPRILKRVNDARNLLEHEYKRPRLSQVEEALDLAALFVDATRRHLDTFEHEFSLGDSREQVDSFHCKRELSFQFENDAKRFRILALDKVPPERERERRRPRIVGEVTIQPTSDEYPIVVRLVVAGDRDNKVRLAIHDLFSELIK